MAASVSVEAQPPVATTRFYRPELDVLRFLAATSVFFFHGLDSITSTKFWLSRGIPQPFAGLLLGLVGSGAYGVDLFFALSSFLITELLLRERQEKGSLDVKAFYIRRALRIWPLYFLFIPFAYAFTFVSHQNLPWKYIAGLLLLFGNWVFVFHGPPNSIAGALWTVCVEEQFYLAWPQVVKRASKLNIKRVAWLLVAAAAATRVFLAWRGSNTDAFWYNTFTRLDPLALGILFALYVHDNDFRLRKRDRVALAVAAIGCWFAVTYFWHLNRAPVRFAGSVMGYPAVALGAIALIAATYKAPHAGWTFFSNPALTYLGKISYGIYVFHELGLYVSMHLLRSYFKHGFWIVNTSIWLATAFAFTIFSAILSYTFLESPFLRLKDRYAKVKSRPV